MEEYSEVDALFQRPVGELAGLPSDQLARLQEAVNRQWAQVRQARELMSAVLSMKYGDRADALRHAMNKEYGLVRIDDEGFIIAADKQKDPQWDQNQLADIVARIREAGDDPQEYVQVIYKVSEKSFGAWPGYLRQLFEPARTLKAKKPTYKFVSKANGGRS